jgi:Ca-activated chloride channel family protein
MQLHFEYPLAFWGLLPVFVFLGLMIFNWYRYPASFSWRRFMLLGGTLFSCVIGLARPQLGRTDTETQSARSNIIFAIDVSKSMLAEDIGPSRLGFATAFAKKLLEQLSGVKVSLFPFAVDGFIQMPLTNDLSVIVDMLQSESPSITTSQGSDLSNSLELLFQGIAKMELASTTKGIDWFPTQVVLFSDGESHYPIKDSVLREFKLKAIPIFTVGIGTKGGTTIPNEGNFGQVDMMRDRAGAIVKTVLVTETLKKISDATGGDYFSARFEEVYPLAKRLTQSMRIARLTTSFRAEKEYYPWFFLLAFFLLSLELTFGRWEYVIRSVMFFAFFSLTFGFSANGRAVTATEEDPNRAYHAFNQGVENLNKKELPKAAELFQESSILAQNKMLKKKALFNLADVLLRLSDPQSALPVLQQAYDLSTENPAFDKETNSKISDNMALAAKILEQLKKQSQPGEGNDPASGDAAPPTDSKGPKKDYKGQLFSEAQKQRIFDLLSNDEQQTIQRLNEQKNKKSSSYQEKPW